VTDLSIDVRGTGAERTVVLEGALDLATVPKLKQVLQGLGPPEITRLVVDVGALDFCDSTGLGTMLGALRRMREGNGDFAIAGASGTVMRLLEVTGLDEIVPLISS
jgi:anti-sigma B factor antagonist